MEESKKYQYREPVYYMKLAKRTILGVRRLGPNDGAQVIALKKKATKYIERAKAAQAERGWSDDDKRMILPAEK